MTQERWDRLTPHEREILRTPATPLELEPFLGWRVEVVDHYGERRRFYVGRSTGWHPVYLEIARRDSTGGISADSRGYRSIRKLYHR